MDVHTDMFIHTRAVLRQRPPCLTTTTDLVKQRKEEGEGNRGSKGSRGALRGRDVHYKANGWTGRRGH